MINKKKLLEKLLMGLKAVHQSAIDAAQRAHDTATDNENIAENKYDTLALEAAYLAQGQSVRVEQCAADIDAFEALIDSPCNKVTLGALVLLLDEQENEKWLFFGPAAGGLKVLFEGKSIVVVTANSPLGQVIEGGEVEQEMSVNIAGNLINYEIMEIH